jgi:ABC-2 type transport system permease protein
VGVREIVSFLVRTTLLPGILGISLALSSLQAVALPMMADFGWTREIEDRLLAPVPVRLIAAEKVVAGVIHGSAALWSMGIRTFERRAVS